LLLLWLGDHPAPVVAASPLGWDVGAIVKKREGRTVRLSLPQRLH
jgi:hypothetical protein